MTEKLQEGCTVQPQTKEELAAIIKQTCEEQGWDCDLNFIDTSKITDMSCLFSDNVLSGFSLSEFCGNISKWNTSNVTDMSYMFCGAETFNGTLNNWDTSNVTNMEGMFLNAVYNQPLDNWYISSHTNIYEMFGDDCCFKSQLPKFTGFEDSKEKLLEKLGLPPDYKTEIKKEQEQEKVHKKSMSR